MLNALLKTIVKTTGLSTYRIGLLQSKAYRILNQETARALKKYNITPVDWALIGLLYDESNGMGFSELASELGVEAPFVTERVKILSTLKLVSITSSKIDKRAKTVELSQTGRSKVPIIEKDLIKSMYPLLKNTKIPDLKGYKHTLEAIIKNKPL